MSLNASFYRQREAVERDRAAEAQLDNVRNVAARAAGAWGREAMRAEQLEAATALRQASAQHIEDEFRQFSENPDRGQEG